MRSLFLPQHDSFLARVDFSESTLLAAFLAVGDIADRSALEAGSARKETNETDVSGNGERPSFHELG